MLEFKGVDVTIGKGIFRKKAILNNITFSLPCGKTLGIVGKSGSGKTTIANVVLRMVRSSAGEVLIDGKSIRKHYSRLELAKKVQLVTQNPETSFDPDMSVGKTFREVLNIHKLLEPNQPLDDLVFPLLRDVGLEGVDLNKPPRYFSGGELQRMSIVRALLVAPEILIFDEADSMLDTSMRIKLFNILNELRGKYNLSYIYITHDIRVLPHLVNTVLVISEGRMIEYGPVTLLKTSKEPFLNELRAAIVMEICR